MQEFEKKKEIEWCFVPAAYTFINIILADWLSCVIAANVVVVRKVLAASQQLLLAAAVCWSSQQMSAQQVALLSTDSLLFPAGSLKKKKAISLKCYAETWLNGEHNGFCFIYLFIFHYWEYKYWTNLFYPLF